MSNCDGIRSFDRVIQPSFAALVPARGGSRGLARKNVRPLAGRPLVAHTLEAALACDTLARTYLTTEDAEIAAIGRALGADVISRPPELSSDETSSFDVALHALEVMNSSGFAVTHIVLLQPTSPLRTTAHIEACLQSYLQAGAASAVSVTAWPHPPQKALTVRDGFLVPLFSRDVLEAPRQSLAPAWRPNGAIYVVGVDDLVRDGSFFIDPVLPFYMREDESVDVDSEEDLALAENIIARRLP